MYIIIISSGSGPLGIMLYDRKGIKWMELTFATYTSEMEGSMVEMERQREKTK